MGIARKSLFSERFIFKLSRFNMKVFWFGFNMLIDVSFRRKICRANRQLIEYELL